MFRSATCVPPWSAARHVLPATWDIQLIFRTATGSSRALRRWLVLDLVARSSRAARRCAFAPNFRADQAGRASGAESFDDSATHAGFTSFGSATSNVSADQGGRDESPLLILSVYRVGFGSLQGGFSCGGLWSRVRLVVGAGEGCTIQQQYRPACKLSKLGEGSVR